MAVMYPTNTKVRVRWSSPYHAGREGYIRYYHEGDRVTLSTEPYDPQKPKSYLMFSVNQGDCEVMQT